MSPAAPLEMSSTIEFFGDPASGGHCEQIKSLFALGGILVPFGQVHRRTEKVGPGNDSHLMQRMGMLEKHIHDSVTCLVPCRRDLLFIAHRQAASFTSPANLVARFFQLGERDRFETTPCRDQGRFIDDIGQLRAGESRCSTRNHGQIDMRREFHLLGVDLENLFATIDIRQTHGYLAIKTSWTQQGWI